MCNGQHVDKKWFGSIKCQEMYMSSRQVIYADNMFIDFIWLNVQAKYPTQTILYRLK